MCGHSVFKMICKFESRILSSLTPLFLTSGLIVDDASEVLDAELRLIAVLGWDVVGVELVLRI